MPTATYCRTLYGKVKGQPGYDPVCDINQDGRIACMHAGAVKD